MFRSDRHQKQGATSRVPLAASASSSSLSSSSFSSSASSSMRQQASSSQSDIAATDYPVPSHLSTPSKKNWQPLSISPAPRSSSLRQMGQTLSRPEPTPPIPVSTSKGFNFRNAFGGRRKQQSEDISPAVSPISLSLNSKRGKGKERSSSDALLENTDTRSLRPLGAKQFTSQITTAFSAKGTGLTPPPTPSAVASPPIPPPKLMGLQVGNGHSHSRGAATVPNSSTANLAHHDGLGQEWGEFGERRVLERKDLEKAEVKEIWRKSDSNMSFNTIRPELVSVANRSSRPVSMADSLQSIHTIVPINKRLSALWTDVDFVMAEEDQNSAATVSGSSSAQGSAKTQKRRSSLSFSSPFPRAKSPTVAHDEPQATARSASDSGRLSPRTSLVTETPALIRAAVSGYISPVNRNTAAQSAGNNIKGRLVAWSATPNNGSPLPMHQERRIPEAPPQRPRQPRLTPYGQTPAPTVRQGAISISNGFGPAAGLAKRAVEKMGRAWGGMHHASNGGGYSSSSSASTHSSQQSTEDFRGPTPPVPISKKHRRTQGQGGGSSGTWSINSSTTSSESDAFVPSSGPVMGKCMRGPSRSGGGAVFGRDLKSCVAETALQATPLVDVRGVDDPSLHRRVTSASKARKEADNKELEARRVPALVVRCAQHILTWGVQEEGLFRLTGRHGHVTKLRNEFDTGADYDLSDCNIGDLDPHAVASIFKAYIRELPEPILTHALMPYFDAAISAETHSRETQEAVLQASRGTKAPGAKFGSNDPTLRKPPSLSTLAMPNFSSMRPPSETFVDALRSLVAALPQENRDLLRTTTELIKATAKRSKETKMPLSNLLLVFCPSMSMSPALLRALCEADGIWNPPEDLSDVLDIKPQVTVTASDISRENSASSTGSDLSMSSDKFADALTYDDGDDTGPVAVTRTVAVSTHQERSTSPTYGGRPLPRAPGARRAPVTTLYLDNKSADELSLQPYASRKEVKHDAPSTYTSEAPSLSWSDTASPVSPDLPNPCSSPPPSSSTDSLTSSEAPSSSHLSVSTALSNKAENTTPSHGPTVVELTHLPLFPAISNVSVGGDIQFPSVASPPATPVTRRPSMPYMSTAASPDGSPSSPPSLRTRRIKKPSLHLLFTRRSSASLNALSTASISGPLSQPSASPLSSGSTPVSRTSMLAAQSSTSSLPPVLDMAFESTPLDFKMHMNEEKRRTIKPRSDSYYTALETPSPGKERRSLSPSPLIQGPNETPIADLYAAPPSSVTSLDLSQNTMPLRPRPRPRPSQSSLASSTASSFNHLSMVMPDESLVEDDWAQSVIAASNSDGSWKNVLKFFG